MRQKKILSLLFALQGVGAFLWTSFTPSESGSAFFLWLSLPRLVLSILVGIFCLFFVGGVLLVWKSPNKRQSWENRLDHWLIEKKQLVKTVLIFSILFLIILAAVLSILSTPLEYEIYGIWAPYTFPLVHSLVEILLPLIVWVMGCLFECVLFLIFRYSKYLCAPEMWFWRHLDSGLVVLIVLVATLFHWVVLVFQFRFFANNLAWYWRISYKPFTNRDLVLVPVVLLFLGLIYWMFKHSERWRNGVAVIFLVGCFLQYGVGYLEGNSMDSLRQRYLSRYHSVYMAKAAENTKSILENIREYESFHGGNTFTSTKPPGLIAFFISLDELINGVYHSFTPVERLERLSWTVTYSFPIIAMGLVLILYKFIRLNFSNQSEIISRIATSLYILCPNIILFTLYPDQALYPGLYLLGALFAVEVVKNQSLLAAPFLGAFLFLANFFTFTSLPLYPLTGLLLAINFWFQRKKLILGRQVALGLLVAVGTILLYFIFREFLNYDFIPRFAKTVLVNHNFDFYNRVRLQPPQGSESFALRFEQITKAAWINNLEFASTVGFPVFTLFIIQAVRLTKRFFKQANQPGDLVLGAFLLTFIILNLAGTAQGEVGRLWMFWSPMVLIFASLEVERLTRKKTLLFLGLLLLQYGTILLTFHFQDLRM